MADPARVDLEIIQGSTFTDVRRYGVAPWVYKNITAIPQAAPLALTVPAHVMPSGWWFAVVGVRGMSQINAANDPPAESDFMQGTVVDANTISVNAKNSLLWTAYQSGGAIMYATPVSLSGCTARMKVRARIDSTDELLSLTTENGGIALDDTLKTITTTITAAATAALTWLRAVYDLELVTGAGVVTRIMGGTIEVSREVTR